MTGFRVARAASWAIAGGAAQYSITFGLLIYLAHVLHPRDFGLMATVTVGLDLGMQIVRWGQVELLQQTRYKGEDERNQAFRVSLALAALFGLIFILAGRPLAKAYASPELASMLYLCAPVFIFTALHATADGILRSEFRFRTLAYRGSIASVLGGAVAVALATSGFGALALAAQRFVQAAVSAIWVWSAVRWRPAIRTKVLYSGALMRDGANTMIGSILPTIVPRSIDLFISVMLGPAQLGLYRIAFRIFEFIGQLVIMPLVGVANAQLARLAHDMVGLRQSYLRFTQVSASLLCPLMIGFGIVAPEAVPILFGNKWVSSVPLIQLVSILALTVPPNYFFAATMIAIGQSRLIIRQGIFQVVVGLSLAAWASQYSLTAVLITQIIRSVLVTVYNFYDLKTFAGLRFRDVIGRMAPPYVATGAMSIVTIGLRTSLLHEYSPLILLAVLTVSGGATYVLTMMLGIRLRLWPDVGVLIQHFVPPRMRRFFPA